MNTNLLDGKAPESDLKSLALGVAGVNMGFGYSKLVLDGLECSFMSAMTPLNRGIEGIGQRKADPLNIVRADDGSLYEVGVDGILNSTDEPLKIMSRDWGRSVQYRMLMNAALNRMAATGKRRWVIYTGLAADHFADAEYRTFVRKLWAGESGRHVTALGDIEVIDVKVLPETAGGLVDAGSDARYAGLLASTEGAILDFGRMTVNWLPFRSGQPDANRMGSIDVGVSAVIQEVTKLVRIEAKKPELHPLDIEAAMMGVRPIYKIVKNASGELSPVVVQLDVALTKAVNTVWPKIEQAITNNLGNLRGKLVIAIGGGVHVFGDKLKSTFPEATVMLHGSAQMANARGLYKMANKALRGS